MDTVRNMSYLVKLPTGQLVEVPDSVPREQAGTLLRNWLQTSATGVAPPTAPPTAPMMPPSTGGTTISGELLEVLKGIPRGAAGLLESAATGVATILPEEPERAARQSITEFFKPAREQFAPAPGYEESVGAKAGEALGSTLPFLATGPLGAAGRLIVGGGLGAASGAEQALRSAEAAGATEGQTTAATALGALVGTTEILPIFRILDRIPEKETLRLLDYVKRAAAAGGEELAQEAASNVAQNLIEKGIYNPDKDLMEGTAEAGAYGFGVGAFVQGVVDLALGRHARGAAARPGGEDERARLGAEQTVAGADTGGAELPVSRVGAERPDLADITTAGVGVPSGAADRMDEREAGVGPALEPARFQMAEPVDEEEKKPWYYSELTRQVEAAPIKSTSPKQWLDTLKSKGVKEEEINYTGFKKWIESKEGNVSKQDALDYLQENSIELQEVMFGGKFPYTVSIPEGMEWGYSEPEQRFKTIEDAKNFIDQEVENRVYEDLPEYAEPDTEEQSQRIEGLKDQLRSQYKLSYDESAKFGVREAEYTRHKHPYGENYREIILSVPTLPNVKKSVDRLTNGINELEQIKDQLLVEMTAAAESNNSSLYDSLYNESKNVDSLLNSLRTDLNEIENKNTFIERHWGTNYGKNAIGHFRISDMNTGKDLLVHEMQSELAQTGGEMGFIGGETAPRVVEYRQKKKDLDEQYEKYSEDLENIVNADTYVQDSLSSINYELNRITNPEGLDDQPTYKAVTLDYDPSTQPGAPEYLTFKLLNGEYVAFERKQFSDGTIITQDNVEDYVGKRVKRGPDWQWGDQDGGEGELGTIISIVHNDPNYGWVRVEWDNGVSGHYRIVSHDLQSAEPRQTEIDFFEPYLTKEDFNARADISELSRNVNEFNSLRAEFENHKFLPVEERERIGNELREKLSDIDTQKETLQDEYEDVADKIFSIPAFPFSSSTDKWQNLLLKKIFKYAVDNGYEKILFAQGQEAKKYTMGVLRGQEYFYDIISPKNIKNLVNKYKGKVTFSKVKSPWELEKKVKDAIDKELAASPSLGDRLINAFSEVRGTRYKKLKNAKTKLFERLRGDEDDDIEYIKDKHRDFFRRLNGGIFGIGAEATPEAEAVKNALQEFAEAVETYVERSAPYYSRPLGSQDESLTYDTRTVIEITPEMSAKLYGAAGRLPLFRMRDRPGVGMSMTAVQRAVNALTKDWTNSPNIKVVESYTDLPKPYRTEKYRNVRGMLLGNDVYIVAKNANSVSDVRSTLFHESLGHYGIRNLYKEKLDTTLADIYQNNSAIKKATNEWLKQYPDVYQGPDKTVRAVEEVLAAKSEAGLTREPGIRAAFNRLAALVRKFLRAMGIVKEYSDNDINEILIQSANRVRTNTTPLTLPNASPKFQVSRYTNVLTSALEQNEKLPEWSQSVGNSVVDGMSKLPEASRRILFKVYTLPHITEVLEKYTPRVRAIDRFIGYRAAYTTDLMKTASENHAGYLRAVRAEPALYDKVKNITNDINLYQVRVRDQDVIDLLAQPRASLSQQKQKYYDIAKRFYDLPTSLQNVILNADQTSGLYADYKKMGDKKFDIFAEVYGGQLGMGVVRRLRENFERERLAMYAPLVRGEGAHWLYYETTDGREFKRSYRNEAERELDLRKASERGEVNQNTVVRATRASELRDRGAPPVGFLSATIESLEKTFPPSLDADARKQIIDGVYDTFLQYLPSNTLRQELSSRQTFEVDGAMQFGVLGFDPDVLAVYDRMMPKMAYQLGNLKYALPLENAMKKINEQAKLYEIAHRENNLPVSLQNRKVLSPKTVFDGIEDIRQRLNFSYNPSYAWWVNAAATGNYVYSIAGNVSSALVNTTVLPMMTFPSLAGKYGVVNASRAMIQAANMFAKGGVDDQGNFTFGNAATGEIKQFFDYLNKRGVIGIAAEQELRQAQRARVSGYESLMDKVNFVMGYVFKNSERFNRETTLLASFMLARKNRSFLGAAEEAIRLNNNINGTVLPEAGSRLYQSNLGRVLLTFRTFALVQNVNLARMFGRALNMIDAKPEERAVARKQLLGVFGMTYLIAGINGLPLFGAAEALAAALMGDDDEPYDLQQEVLDSIGQMGLSGPVNALFKLDIASRTGFNNMFWRDDPKRLSEIGFPLYMLERIGGPTYGLLQSQLRGWEKVAQGDVARGMESILPAPLRNPIKATRYATEGALTKNGLPMVKDISAWNSAMQVFGFAPSELAETQQRISAKFEISDKLNNRRAALLTNLYSAMVTGNSEDVMEAFKAIDKFNMANPFIRIDSKSVLSSFKERQRRAMESVDGLYLPMKLQMTVNQYMADVD